MLLDNFLPIELVDKIYRIRHSLELKDVHNEFYGNKISVCGKLRILKNQNKPTVTAENSNQKSKKNPLYSYYFLNKGSLIYNIQDVYR